MRERKIVLLIDAENTSARYAKRIVNYLEKRGDIICARIYGDFINNNSVKGWNHVAIEYEMEQKQQLTTSAGKNSSDIALVIDAMDLLYQKNIDTLCIVTSDGDFTGLVKRIREDGIEVIGIGKTDASKRLEKVCNQYLDFEELGEQPKDNKSVDKRDKKTNEKNDKSDKKSNKSDKKTTGKLDKKGIGKNDKKPNDKSVKKSIDGKESEKTEKRKQNKKDAVVKNTQSDRKNGNVAKREVNISVDREKLRKITEAISNMVSQEEKKGKKAELGGIKSQLQLQFSDFNEREFGYKTMRDFINQETQYEVVTEGHHTYVVPVQERKAWDKRGIPRSFSKDRKQKDFKEKSKEPINNNKNMPKNNMGNTVDVEKNQTVNAEKSITVDLEDEQTQVLKATEEIKTDSKKRFGFSLSGLLKKEKDI